MCSRDRSGCRQTKGGMMKKSINFRSVLLTGACVALLVSAAHAENFNIPRGDLDSALEAYMTQSGVTLVMSNQAVHGIKSPGVKGELSSSDALSHILSGTGFVPSRNPSGVIEIVRSGQIQRCVRRAVAAYATSAGRPRHAPPSKPLPSPHRNLAARMCRSIPISITALSQEQLTATQTAGGPDLDQASAEHDIHKDEFHWLQHPDSRHRHPGDFGHDRSCRGRCVQRHSVYPQSFLRTGILRRQSGGGAARSRKAHSTAVMLPLASSISLRRQANRPVRGDGSADIGNYTNRRFEGMINIPLVDDRLDLRIAGEWTKRQGYSFNEITDQPIDGRDLWSGRVPCDGGRSEDLQATRLGAFPEDDDRLRSGKQLCKTVNPTNMRSTGLRFRRTAGGAS